MVWVPPTVGVGGGGAGAVGKPVGPGRQTVGKVDVGVRPWHVSNRVLKKL